jgi:transcriptional regulator with XRE-family HTH domain
MPQETIGQRLKFLMEALNLKVRTFANALDVSETNIRNYTVRDSKPSADILERIVRQYPQINTHWLITGEGEPLLTPVPSDQSVTTNVKKNSGAIQTNTGNARVVNNIELEDCKRDLEATRKDAAAYQREIVLLQGQLKDKEEIITLLRGGYNRPN